MDGIAAPTVASWTAWIAIYAIKSQWKRQRRLGRRSRLVAGDTYIGRFPPGSYPPPTENDRGAANCISQSVSERTHGTETQKLFGAKVAAPM